MNKSGKLAYHVLHPNNTKLHFSVYPSLGFVALFEYTANSYVFFSVSGEDLQHWCFRYYYYVNFCRSPILMPCLKPIINIQIIETGFTDQF
jgi:hypothetical protein